MEARSESSSSFVNVTSDMNEDTPVASPGASPRAASPAPVDIAASSNAPDQVSEQPLLADDPPSTPPVDKTKDVILVELEEASAAALEATRQATIKLAKNAVEAKENFTSFVSSLWSALDPPGSSTKTAAQQKDVEKLKEQLGLAPSETILETFRCKLIQTYAPTNNPYTPSKSIGFTCQLHIASTSLCIELDSDRTSPIKVPTGDIASFAREGETVVVKLKQGVDQSVVFGAFALPKLEVDSAVALLEHLITTNPSEGK